MNRNELMQDLAAMGYDVEECNVTKNGVVKNGIRVDGMGNVSPIIYAEDYDTADVASEAIEKAYHYRLPLDIEYVMKTPGAMAERVRIGFQRSSNKQNLVRRDSPFEGIEEYLYVIFDDKGEMSAKLTPEIVATCRGINEYELWERAKRNTFAETTVESLADILGVPTPFGAPNIMVVSNARKLRGASAILDTNGLRETGLSGEYFMLPSSVHEVLLVEYDEDADIDALSEMVRIINGNEVLPEEQLGDMAYRITI